MSYINECLSYLSLTFLSADYWRHNAVGLRLPLCITPMYKMWEAQDSARNFSMATAFASYSEGGSGGLKIDTNLESGTPKYLLCPEIIVRNYY